MKKILLLLLLVSFQKQYAFELPILDRINGIQYCFIHDDGPPVIDPDNPSEDDGPPVIDPDNPPPAPIDSWVFILLFLGLVYAGYILVNKKRKSV